MLMIWRTSTSISCSTASHLAVNVRNGQCTSPQNHLFEAWLKSKSAPKVLGSFALYPWIALLSLHLLHTHSLEPSKSEFSPHKFSSGHSVLVHLSVTLAKAFQRFGGSVEWRVPRAFLLADLGLWTSCIYVIRDLLAGFFSFILSWHPSVSILNFPVRKILRIEHPEEVMSCKSWLVMMDRNWCLSFTTLTSSPKSDFNTFVLYLEGSTHP